MRATARAQPNIALIKYWGKRDPGRNLPAVGSISITLDELFTEMQVDLDAGEQRDRLLVNGLEDRQMLPRVSRCLDSVGGPGRPAAVVRSTCNFPIAAGLASSAAAFAALVVAADAALAGSRDTAQLASLAGQASGSAARSLYGGFVELTNRDDDISVQRLLAGDGWPLKVVVAITTPSHKAVASGEAMEISRKTSPFFGRWVDQQAADLDEAREAIGARDFARLGAVAEHNCLKMHSVMWASRPPMIYWNSATLACMQVVRDLQSAGVAVFFTIDAGPQLKAVCLPNDEARVREALAATDGVSNVMVSGLGAGARRVNAA
ncbi:diphosphomevalonate decarboxylase [Gammaproteobacteria bacterium]|jgi:diphosphomevalonate decarboxylase|nr:diphosphomevalonate decarboxylase [Gammaproteobacteria bacterium]